MSGEELRALAEAATPGPWVAYQEHGRDMTDEGWSEIGVQTLGVTVAFTHAMGWEDNDLAAEDSAFIAAANPTAVLAMLDRLERQARTIRRLYAITHPDSAPPDPEVAECFAEAKEAIRDEALLDERDALRAQVERVEMVENTWLASASEAPGHMRAVFLSAAEDLRAALDGAR